MPRCVWHSKDREGGKKRVPSAFKYVRAAVFVALKDVIVFKCTSALPEFASYRPFAQCLPDRQASNVRAPSPSLARCLSVSVCPSQSVPALIMFAFEMSRM